MCYWNVRLEDESYVIIPYKENIEMKTKSTPGERRSGGEKPSYWSGERRPLRLVV